MNTVRTTDGIGTVSLLLARISLLSTLIIPPLMRRIPDDNVGFPIFLVYSVSVLVIAIVSIGIGSLPYQWRTRKGRGSICIGITALLMYFGTMYLQY